MQKMDADQDGVISIDEFMEACRTVSKLLWTLTSRQLNRSATGALCNNYNVIFELQVQN